MFGELNEKQDEYLKDIYASGTHLLSLINDILDLSKIEAGRMELELTDFHLPTALDNALTLVRERAGRRGIALQMSVDERLGRGSSGRAEDPAGRPEPACRTRSSSRRRAGGSRSGQCQRTGPWRSRSATPGSASPRRIREAVFEEFRQVGTADKKAEGTGLGLTSAGSSSSLHGGRIWVKSPGRCGLDVHVRPPSE